jgi:hypothetical protein
MWNHSTAMRAEMERNGIRLPLLTGQELADLLIYARRTAGQARPPSPVFHSNPEHVKAFVRVKGLHILPRQQLAVSFSGSAG